MGVHWDDAQTAGGEGSTSMSVLARDEELLVEQNDIARLSLPAILLIFLQNEHNTTRGTGLGKIKMLVFSCPKVNRPVVSRLEIV